MTRPAIIPIATAILLLCSCWAVRANEIGSEALAPDSKSDLAVCKFATISDAYALVASRRQIDCALILGKISKAFRNSFDAKISSDWPLATGVEQAGYLGGRAFLPGSALIKLNEGAFDFNKTARLHGYQDDSKLIRYIVSMASPQFLNQLSIGEADIGSVLSQNPDPARLQQVKTRISAAIQAGWR